MLSGAPFNTVLERLLSPVDLVFLVEETLRSRGARCSAIEWYDGIPFLVRPLLCVWGACFHKVVKRAAVDQSAPPERVEFGAEHCD